MKLPKYFLISPSSPVCDDPDHDGSLAVLDPPVYASFLVAPLDVALARPNLATVGPIRQRVSRLVDLGAAELPDAVVVLDAVLGARAGHRPAVRTLVIRFIKT